MNPYEQNDPFLRIRGDKVMQLLDLVGELGLATVAVTRHPAVTSLEQEGLESATHRLELLTRQVQELASSLRLVPAGQVFQRMKRLVRDLAKQTGKSFHIVLHGEDVQIDKTMLDQLAEPLLHLIRNAADHGLETPAERKAAGKPEQGRITLSAAQQGQEIHIEVRDDGRGLKGRAILKRARETGLVGENECPDDETMWNLIFKPGFSSATEVSNLSGRGVGLDVVRSVVHSLRGRTEVETEPGQGTRVKLILPVTLAFLESLVVRSKERLYAIPIDVVFEVFKPKTDQIVHIRASNSVMVSRQGTSIPINQLHSVDSMCVDPNNGDQPLEDQLIVVVQTSHGSFGLPVDEIVGQQHVVMKPLKGYLRTIRGGAGCALLSSGEVAIAMDVERLSQELFRSSVVAPGAAR